MIDKKFRSDILFGYFAQGGSAIASLLLMLVITRYGSLATYGALMLLASLTAVMGNLLSFRTSEALVAFYKQGEAMGNAHRCKFSIVASIFLDLLVGLLLVSIFILGSDLLAVLLLKDIKFSNEVQLYGYLTLLMILKSSPLALLQATERMKWVNVITLAENCAKLIIASYISFTTHKLDLHTTIWIFLFCSSVATFTAYIPLILKLCTQFRNTTIDISYGLVLDYAKFTLKTFASSALKAGNQNIDSLILGVITNPHIVGIYATFRQFLSPISFITGPVEAVAYPRFVKAITQKNHHEVKLAINNVNKKLLLAFTILIAFIFPIASGYSYIIDLQLDSKSYFVLFLMMITAMLRGRLWWARPFSNSTDPNLSLYANCFATIFLLATLYPVTWALGLTGTALCMLVASALLNMYWFYALKRYV